MKRYLNIVLHFPSTIEDSPLGKLYLLYREAVFMGKNYEIILVAIDGSDASRKAFERAVKLAKENDAKLILTHVIDSRTYTTPQAYDKLLIEREREYVNEFMGQYLEDAKEAGIKDCETLIEFGSPRVKIAKDIVKRVKANLIICGATGLNAVERFLIGSVSESIVRYAPCDVLVVR